MRRLVLVLLLSTSACSVLRRPAVREDAVEREWSITVTTAKAYADSGRHADADRLLAAFAAAHPGAPRATETLYWRGVHRLDPSNKVHTAAEAVQMFDAYLAARPDTASLAFQAEAAALRRAAAQIDQLSRAVAAAQAAADAAKQTAATSPEPRPADAAKDQEIARLKAELATTTDELNRIKRRLQTRRP